MAEKGKIITEKSNRIKLLKHEIAHLRLKCHRMLACQKGAYTHS
ncbi:hypothetical protein Hdeb2414_s0018g00518421 [Helianthus debilis subsp. tardiflorus]